MAEMVCPLNNIILREVHWKRSPKSPDFGAARPGNVLFRRQETSTPVRSHLPCQSYPLRSSVPAAAVPCKE